MQPKYSHNTTSCYRLKSVFRGIARPVSALLLAKALVENGRCRRNPYGPCLAIMGLSSCSRSSRELIRDGTATTFHPRNVATHLKSSTSAIVYSSLFEPLSVLLYRPDLLQIGFGCALSRGSQTAMPRRLHRNGLIARALDPTTSSSTTWVSRTAEKPWLGRAFYYYYGLVPHFVACSVRFCKLILPL